MKCMRDTVRALLTSARDSCIVCDELAPSAAVSADYELVLAFDRDTPAFTHGVEIGVLWQRLQTEPLPVVATLHAANAEMALRLADALDLPVRSNELNDDWLSITYG